MHVSRSLFLPVASALLLFSAGCSLLFDSDLSTAPNQGGGAGAPGGFSGRAGAASASGGKGGAAAGASAGGRGGAGSSGAPAPGGNGGASMGGAGIAGSVGGNVAAGSPGAAGSVGGNVAAGSAGAAGSVGGNVAAGSAGNAAAGKAAAGNAGSAVGGGAGAGAAGGAVATAGTAGSGGSVGPSGAGGSPSGGGAGGGAGGGFGEGGAAGIAGTDGAGGLAGAGGAPSPCGNGVKDAGEPCDGADLAEASCETATGAQAYSGTLQCGAGCAFDTTLCTCGNGQVEPAAGEECDRGPPGSDDRCASCRLVCPDGGKAFGGHCYARSTQEEPWDEAVLRCIAKNAHLVTIGSAAENEHVFSLIGTPTGGDTRYWIGLDDTKQEGKFVWITGEPLTYTSWRPGQPNNLGLGEDCAVTSSKDGQWIDNPCLFMHFYICEIDQPLGP